VSDEVEVDGVEARVEHPDRPVRGGPDPGRDPCRGGHRDRLAGVVLRGHEATVAGGGIPLRVASMTAVIGAPPTKSGRKGV
jgi:hypothetical protein